MRAIILPAAALVLACAVVLAGGRMVEAPVDIEPVALDQPSAEDVAIAEGMVASASQELASIAEPAAGEQTAPAEILPLPPSAVAEGLLPEAATSAVAPQGEPADAQAKPTAASRLVAPAIVAPPGLAAEELQREAPREPLSQLSLALPPPEFKNEWAGKPLFRPVAMESAVFESGGHMIAIAGVKSVELDKSCVYEDASWPCGVRARTAFRLWLRGRALVCQIPEAEQDKPVMRARCRLAKQDVGAWLVSNGWALAVPDGPYVQAEEKARVGKVGIFGAPPDASSISAVPDAPASVSGETQQIMTEEGVDPQPALSPQAEPAQGAFPPAPPAP